MARSSALRAPTSRRKTTAAKSTATKSSKAKNNGLKRLSGGKAKTAKKVSSSSSASKTAKKTAAKKTASKKTAAKKAPSKKLTKVAKAAPEAAELERPLHREAPVLSMESDLGDLWATFKRTNDQNLRNIIIELHMPLVRTIAERLLQTLPKSIDLDDLTSAGTFGLMDAIGGFDLSRGIKFKTYCTTRIRGSILDELRSQDWVPRLVRLKAHRLEKAHRKLEGELGRDPNQYELAEAMEMNLTELQATRAEAHAKAIFSLSEKWDDGNDDSDMEKVEILADKKCQDPTQTMQQKDMLEVLTSNLTKKERLIIIMYYYEGLTMREIGEIMELTESRVCQIHSNVMSRLKTQVDQVSLQTS